MNPAENVINVLFEKLEKFTRTETVIGEQIQVGNITLIPIVSVSFGLGAGGGSGGDGKEQGCGSAGGTGAKIQPNAMLVIKDGEVSAIPLNSKGSFDKLFEMLPELIDKVDCCKPKNESTTEE